MAKSETQRGPGRPPSFTVPTVAVLSNIPVETRDMVKNLAKQRGEPMNVTLDTLIRRGYRETARRK